MPHKVIVQPKRFWWVWTKGGKTPTKFHHSHKSAEVEAIRLAVKHPDRKFIVLEALSKVHLKEVA